jgi:hypothetical protein
MFETNRYDNLQAKAKRLRNKSEKRNARDTERIRALNAKISTIKYKKEVFNTNINNKLTDVESLITNEQNRILRDKIQVDYEDVIKPEIKAEINKAKSK